MTDLAALPPELLDLTTAYLSDKDLRALYLTCRYLSNVIAPKVWKTVSVGRIPSCHTPGTTLPNDWKTVLKTFKTSRRLTDRMRFVKHVELDLDDKLDLVLLEKLAVLCTNIDILKVDLNVGSSSNTDDISSNSSTTITTERLKTMDRAIGKLQAKDLQVKISCSLPQEISLVNLLDDSKLSTLDIRADALNCLPHGSIPNAVETLTISEQGQNQPEIDQLDKSIFASGVLLKSLKFRARLNDYSVLEGLLPPTHSLELTLFKAVTSPIYMPNVKSFSVTKLEGVHVHPMDHDAFKFDHLQHLKIANFIATRNMEKIFRSNPYLESLQMVQGQVVIASYSAWQCLYLNSHLKRLAIDPLHILAYMYSNRRDLPEFPQPVPSLELLQLVTNWNDANPIVTWDTFKKIIGQCTHTFPNLKTLCMAVDNEPHGAAASVTPGTSIESSIHPKLYHISEPHNLDYLDNLHEGLCQEYLLPFDD